MQCQIKKDVKNYEKWWENGAGASAKKKDTIFLVQNK